MKGLRMDYSPKQKQCECGNTVTVDSWRMWCRKCGKPVYYESKDQKLHKINTIYLTLIFIGTVFFLVYVFVEMIAKPWTNAG
jgi:hypothetical protein